MEYVTVMSYIENINLPHDYDWIGGVSNGTHWHWDQAGTEPETDMYMNGEIPQASSAQNLMITRQYSRPISPASPYAGIVSIHSFMAWGKGICELF